MKTRCNSLYLAFLLFTLTAIAQPHVPPARKPAPIQHVIVISIDGLMPDVYLHPEAHGLEVPALRAMMENGAYSRGVTSVFPTVTYPSHASMATGCNPGTHGIVTNRAWDPLERNAGGLRWYAEDLQVPTIWDLLRSNHLPVALIGWPVTVGAHSDLLIPDFWRANTAEDVKLLRAVSTPGLLDAADRQFPRLVSRYLDPNARDEAMTDVAVYLIGAQRPSLLMLHLIKLVYKEHVFGPYSQQAIAATEDVDRQVARVIEAVKKAGLAESSIIMVVSDYGFTRTSKDVHPGVLLAKAGLVTFDQRHQIKDWKAIAMPMDGTTYIYVKDPDDHDTQQKVINTFHSLVGQSGSGISRMFTNDQIRARGGDPRAFLALEAEDGFSMEPGYSGDYSEPSDMIGTHGFFPDRPEMSGSLLVMGPNVRRGEVAGARLIDIAPTVAGWFGLRLDKAEGIPLQVIERSASGHTVDDQSVAQKQDATSH
jgi:predicted AlkP superfamily pyrophosphatase or phosphodiesterase